MLIKDQDALRVLAVSTCPTGLLEIIFQRPGDIGVQDQADVVLVDPHAKGVCCTDHRDLTGDELFEEPFFQRCFQAGMESLRRIAGPLQELCKLFGVFLRRAVDDNATLAGKTFLEQLEDRLLLLVAGDGEGLIVEVGAFMSPFELQDL